MAANINDKWPTWLFSYNLDGSQWSMEVVAPSAEEAKRRLAAAAAWGTLDGELIAKVPVGRGGILVPLIVLIRNFLHPQSQNKKEG